MSHPVNHADNPGPGVDAEGNPVFDPTRNVLNLVEAAIKRQDDLREMESRWRDKVESIRADYQMRLNEVSRLHSAELRKAEGDRIDAIRAVDVAASQQQQKDAETRASTLANTSTASAEALRGQVATTATAFDAKLLQALDPIQKRLDGLSQAQYEAAGGKLQVAEGRAGTSNVTAIIGAVIAVLAIALTLYATRSKTPTVNVPTPTVTVTTPAP